MNPLVGNALSKIFGRVVDTVLPDKTQADAAKLKYFELAQSGELAELSQETEIAKAQIDVNKIDAQSDDKFTSRARPFIIWVCGITLLYAGLIEPILRFIARVFYGYTGDFPEIDTVITLQVLFGLLGLGGMRSFDKYVKVKSR